MRTCPFVPRLPSTGAVVLLIVGIVLLLVTDEEGGQGREERSDGSPERVGATVVRVVDGDTAQMELETAAKKKTCASSASIRPSRSRPGQPVECFGKKASRFNPGSSRARRWRSASTPSGATSTAACWPTSTWARVRQRRARPPRLCADARDRAEHVDYADRFARLEQAAATLDAASGAPADGEGATAVCAAMAALDGFRA